ncbi:LexA family protein [Brevundimonas sp.]|uniref:LexA family protein n=1 Tax=Brevundimonas sp. TaxID=1871086 RepID=UPI002AB9C37C|nr:S24 family peptidase [Brevundimonas sp.]MDZ4364890.1 S24 family peptidase [Brevundimonas sp.]
MGTYQGDDTTGFQSPAQDYIEPVVDLAKLLDLRRPGLYPVRVVGHELRARGIHAGDILIANAAAEPVSGKVCVAFLKGEVMLATLTLRDESWWLKASSGEPVEVADDIEIWAIISALVRVGV